MIEAHFTRTMNPKIKALAIIIVLLVVGAIIGYVVSLFSLQVISAELEKLPIQVDPVRIARSINYYTAALICLAIEIVLLMGLLYMYYDSYRKTKSRFLIGLNMFIVALLIRSILSMFSLHTIATDYLRVSPFVSRTFLTPGFTEINFVVYIFEILAISILLYLSME